MTRIDFYVLQKQNTREAQFQFACRLVEKAVKQGNRVLIATDDAAATQHVDQLLWSFKPESFIPHSADTGEHTGELNTESPVFITHREDDEKHHDVMVNLALNLPPWFSRFQRVAEIVVQEDQVLAASRKNYAWYKERGYPLNTHKM